MARFAGTIAGLGLLLVGCGGGGWLAEPVDLAPWARIVASATRPTEPFPWTREAEDGIGAVRDDSGLTGWKAPREGLATVTLDLQPWLGRAVRLYEMRLETAGSGDASVTAQLMEGCGSTPIVSLPWSDLGLPLPLGDRPAGCVQLWIEPTGDFQLSGIQLLSRDSSVALPADVPVDLRAGPALFLDSGTIEGFYGVPWSWRERRRMIAHLARHRLGSYVYAPKNDPLHRDAWRTPYPDEFVGRFSQLARFADSLGVRALLGISPMIDYNPSADYQTLHDKLLPFVRAGVPGVMLLADDIEMEASVDVGAELASVHVEAANRLLSDLRQFNPGLAVWFVGTVYSDARADAWAGGQAYLEGLARLDPAIAILWTGADTSVATMAGAEMERFRAATGRRPLIWDNFWANDGGDGFAGRILLAPFEGRSADLPPAVVGVAHNPSIGGAVSRLSTGTFAAWLADPVGYDPVGAIAAAAAGETRFSIGPVGRRGDDAELLGWVAGLFDGHAQKSPTRSPALTERVDRLIGLLEADEPVNPADLTSLLPLLARMSVVRSELHHSGIDPDLVDELAVPLARIEADGEAGLWALALLGEKLAGREGRTERQRALDAIDRARWCRVVSNPETVRRLFEAVDAWTPSPASPASDGWATPGLPPPVGECTAGQPVPELVFPGIDLLCGAAGLPGAARECLADGRVGWTPPHAGAYRMAVHTVQQGSPIGWAFRIDEVVCGAR